MIHCRSRPESPRGCKVASVILRRANLVKYRCDIPKVFKWEPGNGSPTRDNCTLKFIYHLIKRDAFQAENIACVEK